METANSGREASAFLEAHFYDNGVRHVAFPSKQDRPTWAPPSERTGIKNADLKMRPGMAVVEYSRVAVGHNEADWLGVFWPSGDQQLGNRGNYAGIGLWTQGCRYSSCDDLVDVLGQISSLIAQSMGVPTKLESNILAFIKDFLPSHLADDAMLPVGILPIEATGGIAKTKVEALTFSLGGSAKLPPEVCKVVADRVMVANLTRDPRDDFSRLLIVVTDDHAGVRDGAISPIGEVPDLISHILKSIGAQGVKSRQRADQLAIDNAQMAQQLASLEAAVLEAQKNEDSLMADLSDLREVNRALEAENALPPDLVRRLDRIDSVLTSLSALNETIPRRFNFLDEKLSQIAQSRAGEILKTSQAKPHAIRPAPQSERPFWKSKGFRFAIWAFVLLIAVVVGFLIWRLF
jgi:hypothetical protein